MSTAGKAVLPVYNQQHANLTIQYDRHVGFLVKQYNLPSSEGKDPDHTCKVSRMCAESAGLRVDESPIMKY